MAGDPARADRRKSGAAALLMCLAVLAAYVPVPAAPDHNTLYGSDYLMLHVRRIRFAQEALLTGGSLPAWYPRELMGTPFWSNVQNFPFIPTRLVLLALDPLDAFAAGVSIAAVLSAAFTFLFCRRLGVGLLGSAAAGWTFACAGFFASRVNAGHLPLLEAYPLLPLWLWLAEACRSSGLRDRRAWRWHAALALAGLCGALAGHPQLPLYAAVVTGLYLLCRGPLRTTARVGTALALGMACSAFAVWPMLALIGRSTRVLPLAAAANDVPFPLSRLGALVLPWKDGWPEAALAAPGRPFTGYPDVAYFWDTVCYVGWLPLVAAALLLARAVRRRERPGAAAAFFAAAGLLALLTALPAAQQVAEQVPGTLVRSPARQVYVTTFALALAAGAAVHLLVGRARRPGAGTGEAGLVVAVLLAHAIDLGAHARAFVRTVAITPGTDRTLEESLRQAAGDGRVAVDYQLAGPYVRAIDDVGVFDSTLLANPYRALLDLAGLPETHNVQALNGSELNARALESTGVRVVVTPRRRPDLEPFSPGTPGPKMYRTPDPAARAAFFTASAALRLDEAATRARLRDPAHDLRRHVMVPAGDHGLPPQAGAGATPATVAYERESSDAVVVRVRTTQPGFLRVLESWDPGWAATVNGAPADVLPADLAFMAVALPAGEFEVRFTYSTPGAVAGVGISAASACALAGFLMVIRRRSAHASTVRPANA